MIKKKQNIQFLIKIQIIFVYLFLLVVQSAFAIENPFLSNSNSKSEIFAPDKKTVLVIFDASGSMEETINGETKLHIAKRVLEDVLLKADIDINIGLRMYGASGQTGNPSVDCTDSKLLVFPGPRNRRTIVSEVQKTLPSIHTKKITRGLTPISYSLVHAVKDLLPFTGEKSIILISDGAETCFYDPCELAHKIAENHVDVTINVVGFGISDDYIAQKQLKCVALATHGKYYAANNAKELTSGLIESFSKTVTGGILGEKTIVKPVESIPVKDLPILESEMIEF